MINLYNWRKRTDLKPTQIADTLATLKARGKKQKELASEYDFNESEVSMYLTLHRGHELLRNAVDTGQISLSAIEPILTKPPIMQARLAEKVIVAKTVRKVRALVKAHTLTASTGITIEPLDYLSLTEAQDIKDMLETLVQREISGRVISTQLIPLLQSIAKIADSKVQAMQPKPITVNINTIPDIVFTVHKAIRDNGGQPFIVGGCVRDLLLDKKFDGDIDSEVYGMSFSKLKTILTRFGHTDAVGKFFGVIKIRSNYTHISEHTYKKINMDFSLPRKERKIDIGHTGFSTEFDPTLSKKEATARRDFTINSMLLDLPTSEIIDLHSGYQDLQDRILRHTSNAYSEDPLRVLRGFQFISRFELTPAFETIEMSRQLLDEYSTLSKERIWGEWWKWATKGTALSKGLIWLKQTHWITMYPELVALFDVPQNPLYHPEGDVWQHTLCTVDAMQRISYMEVLEPHERAILIFAALCHDMGKQETTFTKDGKIVSPGHARISAEMAQTFLTSIGAPKKIIESVVPLVKGHMISPTLTNDFVPRTIRRLALRLAPATIKQLSYLMEADHINRPNNHNHINLRKAAEKEQVIINKPKPIIMGRHLLKLGLTEGPNIGHILRIAFSAQLDGIFITVDEGIKWLDENNYLWEK